MSSDYLATAATIIPVFILAITVQGPALGKLLVKGFNAAHGIVKILVVLGWIIWLVPIGLALTVEGQIIHVMAYGHTPHGFSGLVFGATLISILLTFVGYGLKLITDGLDLKT